VQRVVIVRERPGEEAVISRVVDGAVEQPIEAEQPALLVELVLVPAPAGDFDDDVQLIRRFRAGGQVVPGVPDHGCSFSDRGPGNLLLRVPPNIVHAPTLREPRASRGSPSIHHNRTDHWNGNPTNWVRTSRRPAGWTGRPAVRPRSIRASCRSSRSSRTGGRRRRSARLRPPRSWRRARNTGSTSSPPTTRT